ncbi:MAG: 1-acyl-sn-glycerol-3-phosphate acyltransferase [Myxococcaceae bacterium]|nr:1-acyl-sn-glycerol-3-phosphate acyltransferase [Myxococcaceae bacterium]
MWFYRAFRAVVALLLKLFYRLEPVRDPHGGLTLPGPVIFVGNHPNGLVDPGMVFAFTRRHVTFLSKAPLFKIPVLGWMLRAMQALPVFRRQDNAGDMAKNDSTLNASVEALTKGRAIMIFPEGKSHSEPQLAELKTGCARIALEALRQGAPVKIVPVGLNYLQKDLFRSRGRADVGAILDPAPFVPKEGEDPREAARRLTEAIADALRAVTLNLEQWEDLPLVQTAEALYALKVGDPEQDTERLRAFARGMQLLRAEQPERFERIKGEVLSFQHRLCLVDARARELTYAYRPATVGAFVLRNLLWLLGLPLVLLGIGLFAIPYAIPIAMVRLTRPEVDTEATVKVLTLLVLAPLWWALLTVGAWLGFGWGAGLAALLGTLPLALFTRVFLERRASALRDARVFLVLGSRRRLKERLVAEGEALAAQIETVAEELRPRVAV